MVKELLERPAKRAEKLFPNLKLLQLQLHMFRNSVRREKTKRKILTPT
jgi:hypothetical protein